MDAKEIFCFNGNQSLKIDLHNIKAKKGIYTDTDIVIHDSFSNVDDKVYYLVTKKSDILESGTFDPKQSFWLTENQLKKSLTENFRLNFDVNLSETDSLCNINKVNFNFISFINFNFIISLNR